MLLVALLLAAMPSATVRLFESGSAKVGSAAPSFGGWDLKGERVLTLDGVRRTPFLAPLLITFGASWCKPCIEGLPRLNKFARGHPEMRLVFIDVESEPEKAQQLAAKTGIDAAAKIRAIYGVEGEDLEKVLELDLEAARIPDLPSKLR